MRASSCALATVLAAGLLSVSACSSSSPGATPPTMAGAATATSTSTTSASASAVPSPTPSASRTAVPVLSNPCQVLTRSEATRLSGVSMPAGVNQPWGTGARKCGYTSGPVEAFVILERARTGAKAQAAWDAERTKLQQQAQPAGIKVTATAEPGIGDRAELFVGTATIGGVKNTLMALFILNGATFIDLGDFALQNAKPATKAAILAQGTTCAGRV